MYSGGQKHCTKKCQAVVVYCICGSHCGCWKCLGDEDPDGLESLTEMLAGAEKTVAALKKQIAKLKGK